MTTSKRAAAGGPDPISFKAFISEYQSGFNRGSEVGGSYMDQEGLQDEIVSAAREIEVLCKRIISTGEAAGLKMKERKVAAKFSENLSTLFYNMGRIEGMREKASSKYASDDDDWNF